MLPLISFRIRALSSASAFVNSCYYLVSTKNSSFSKLTGTGGLLGAVSAKVRATCYLALF